MARLYPIGAVVLFIGLALASLTATAAETTLLNRDSDHDIRTTATTPAMSADGSIIVFTSDSTQLATPTQGIDTNGSMDVFVLDTTTNVIEYISVNDAGAPGNAASTRPDISADGRYVTFESASTTLFPPTSTGNSDIYIRDRQLNTTRLVSRSYEFQATNGDSTDAAISADGRYVAFTSSASNIVLSDTNSRRDVFLSDRTSLTVSRISVSTEGTEGTLDSLTSDISADGRFVVFVSFSNNLVAIDTNQSPDVFRRDTQTGVTVAVSKRTDFITFPFQDPIPFDTIGDSSSSAPTTSSDGRFVAFSTQAKNLHGDNDAVKHLVVRDMNDMTGLAELITQDSNGMPVLGDKTAPSISDNGQYVYFKARSDDYDSADNSGWYDSFLMNRETGHVERISVADDNSQSELVNLSIADDGSSQRRISEDGRYVVFASAQNGLVADDFNSEPDVFLRDRGDDCPASLAGVSRTLPSDTWLLAALPCNPPSNRSTVGELFADDIDGALFGTWAVFTYDDSTTPPTYVQATLDTRLKTGEGFWIQQVTGSNVTLDLPEGARQATARASQPVQACVSPDGCYVLPLSGEENDDFRWNLIGNPFAGNSSVAFDDLRVRDILGPCSILSGCTMAEAAQPSANIAFNRFFHYDGTSYSVREQGSVLQPWEGYWAVELSGSESAAPVILFPK